MITNYLREDKYGNPVRVEIWRGEDGKFVRIKRIFYGNIEYRSDIYAEDDQIWFNIALQEEITYLMQYEQALKDVMKPMAEFEQKKSEPEQATLQRLQSTVALLQR